jgi:hypothetical protein
MAQDSGAAFLFLNFRFYGDSDLRLLLEIALDSEPHKPELKLDVCLSQRRAV